MHSYRPHEPIGREVPTDDYLRLMIERVGVDLDPIISIVKDRSLILENRTLVPLHMEDYVYQSAKDVAQALRKRMSKWRKEEIPTEYIEKFAAGIIFSKLQF